MHINKIELSGDIVKLYPTKQTPDGLKVASFVLEHKSMQNEANISRSVKCRIFCLIVGVNEEQLAILESDFISVEGFLSQNSKSQIVLNVTKIIDKGT